MKLKQCLSLLVVCLVIIVGLFAVRSFALWLIVEEQAGINEVNVGCFSIDYHEDTASINLNNTYPTTDRVGLSGNPYTFTITNTCTIKSQYTLTLNTLKTNTLGVGNIKYALYKTGEEKPTVGQELKVINPETKNLNITNLGTSYILDTGVLSGGTKVGEKVTNGGQATYNLYLWISDAAGNEVEGQNFEASINVVGSAIQ